MKKIKLLYYFTLAQALSCIFPALIFIILGLSKYYQVSFIYRYDLIFLLCVIVQIALIASKLETIDEFKVIVLFHLIGLILEIYKVHMGSWNYPEKSMLKIFNVPLYSGFMYSSVASYVCQAWKRLKLNFINWPNKLFTFGISGLIYLNFFTHHFIYDVRWFIIIALIIIFRKSTVEYFLSDIKLKMPLVISFLLIGFFIWVAENISTYLGAWTYPNQKMNWHMVHLGKITSWFMLVIISIIIVVNLKNIKSEIIKN